MRIVGLDAFSAFLIPGQMADFIFLEIHCGFSGEPMQGVLRQLCERPFLHERMYDLRGAWRGVLEDVGD